MLRFMFLFVFHLTKKNQKYAYHDEICKKTASKSEAKHCKHLKAEASGRMYSSYCLCAEMTKYRIPELNSVALVEGYAWERTPLFVSHKYMFFIMLVYIASC